MKQVQSVKKYTPAARASLQSGTDKYQGIFKKKLTAKTTSCSFDLSWVLIKIQASFCEKSFYFPGTEIE